LTSTLAFARDLHFPNKDKRRKDMMRKTFATVLSLLVVASMLLAACGSAKVTPEATEQATNEPAATEEQVPVTTRHGGWADEIVFTGIPEQPNGIAQLQADAIDVYAVTVDDASLFESVSSDTNLAYSNSYGSFDAFMFNPDGPEFADGRLNPFSNPKIREAMNWLLDRKYVGEEVVGNGAKPKTVVLISAFPDYALYADIIRPLENRYAYNIERARSVVATEMEAMGAVMGNDGKWQYNGAPVVILGLIRTEDEREDIGNYLPTNWKRSVLRSIACFVSVPKPPLCGNPAHPRTGSGASIPPAGGMAPSFAIWASSLTPITTREATPPRPSRLMWSVRNSTRRRYACQPMISPRWMNGANYSMLP
jgi:hypothetical protein